MPLPDNTKMSTGDLPSCLCKRGSKCHKFSPPNIGTGILQDKSVEALWNVDSLIRRHIEGNPHRTFVMRLLMKPTVVVGKNSLVKTLLTEKNDCMDNMLKDFFLGLFGNGIMSRLIQNSELFGHKFRALVQKETRCPVKTKVPMKYI